MPTPRVQRLLVRTHEPPTLFFGLVGRARGQPVLVEGFPRGKRVGTTSRSVTLLRRSRVAPHATLMVPGRTRRCCFRSRGLQSSRKTSAPYTRRSSWKVGYIAARSSRKRHGVGWGAGAGATSKSSTASQNTGVAGVSILGGLLSFYYREAA